jgi:hypothetical protein
MRKNDVFGTLEARNAERVAFCLLKTRKNNVFGTLEARNAERVALKQVFGQSGCGEVLRFKYSYEISLAIGTKVRTFGKRLARRLLSFSKADADDQIL